jgi:hypothetical protein
VSKKKRLERLGLSRGQLLKRNERLEAELARLRPEPGLRKEGSHWYSLLDYFDPNEIQAIPITEDAYLMGMLEHAIVVEVPSNTTMGDTKAFTKSLAEKGIRAPVLFVQPGVRFLRIGAVSAEGEKKLDERLKEIDREAPEEPAQPRVAAADGDAPGDGPEPPGDGLGDRMSAEGADLGGRGDRDEAADEAGEAPPDGV